MNILVNLFYDVLNSYWFAVFIKIILGVILCGAIGLERQGWNKPAGFKTYIILGLCGVFTMLLSEYIALEYGITDITRMPAQLLTGIGFIGAGAILKDGFTVKGITTAAGLLAVTIIGLAVGAGFYVGAIFGTIVIYLLLSYSQPITDKLIQYINIYFIIRIHTISEETINEIKEIFSKNNINIKYINFMEGEKKENASIKIKAKYKEGTNINNIISTLMALDNITEVAQETKDE